MFFEYSAENMIPIIRSLLREDEEGEQGYFFADDTLRAYINMAICVIAELTGSRRGVSQIEFLNGYRLASIVKHKIIALEYNGVALMKIIPSQISHVPINGSQPQYWFEYGNYVGIEPIPNDDYTLTMYSIDNIENFDNIKTLLPYMLNNLIFWYVLAKAHEQDGQMVASSFYMRLFYQELDYATSGLMASFPRGNDNG